MYFIFTPVYDQQSTKQKSNKEFSCICWDYSLVENVEFKELLSEFHPQYQVPGRFKELDIVYSNLKKYLENHLI